MSFFKKILSGIIFVVGGIVTITVGFFMLRGTMRMWDKNDKKKHQEDKRDEK